MDKQERMFALKTWFNTIQNRGAIGDQYYYGESYNIFAKADVLEACNHLKNDIDKVVLSQFCNSYIALKKTIKNIQLTPKQKIKLQLLKKYNIEICDTLNFELLDDKYDFLKDELPLLTIDKSVQMQLVSLDDNRLSWFRKLYEKVREISSYPASYLSQILSSVGYNPMSSDEKSDQALLKRYEKSKHLCTLVDKYVDNGNSLTNRQIESLVFLLGTKAGVNLSKYIEKTSDLNDLFDKNNPIQKHISNKIEEQRRLPDNERNAETIKKAIFYKFFGLQYGDDPYSCDVPLIFYRFTLDDLKETPENKYLFETYYAIAKVDKTNDSKNLLSLFDNLASSGFEPSYFSMMTLENQMRMEFTKQINNSLFSLEGRKKKKVGNAFVYDAGTDFKMLITAVGAYQNLEKSANYKDFWNSSLLRSHGNCCSLISNSCLATARQPSVVFGFRNMPEESLLAGGYTDLNSTPKSRNYDINFHNVNQQYFSPDELINRTRDYYNELNFERIDISKNGKFFKKNPDYIVFFEEFEDFQKELKIQKNLEPIKRLLIDQHEKELHRWEESVKASVQLGIPIVKINRETCAKSERAKLDENLKLFKKTKDPTLIKPLITQYLNNYTGLRDEEKTHFANMQKYFSKKGFNTLQDEIETVIRGARNKNKQKMFDTYSDVLFDESQYCTRADVNYASNFEKDDFNRLSNLEDEMKR